MKYMHFNSSCSYAGLANMLEMYGCDTEDYILTSAKIFQFLPVTCRVSGRHATGRKENLTAREYKIALDMGLPFYIRYDGKTRNHRAGVMLQSKEWFELYLRPRGFCYIEKTVSRESAADILYPGMMLGIRLSPQSKHAVVFVKREGDRFIFIYCRPPGFTVKQLVKVLCRRSAVGIHCKFYRCAV